MKKHRKPGTRLPQPGSDETGAREPSVVDVSLEPGENGEVGVVLQMDDGSVVHLRANLADNPDLLENLQHAPQRDDDQPQ